MKPPVHRTASNPRPGRDKRAHFSAGGNTANAGLEGGNSVKWRYERALKDGAFAREHGKVRTLADMPPGEVAALEARLGAKVKR